MIPPLPLTLGTAGHVDHGKTALVAALTGVDTDRLPEERRRGLTIALGYAPLRLPSGRQVSVVDVPGHERFVRTMVAGASGIDGFLLVVAADDGVMPQTVEHVAVLRALAVGRGVVAITKADLADPGPAAAAAAALVPGCEVVAVSVRDGSGLDGLRAALERLVAGLPSRAARPDTAPLLHVDRVFGVAGRGTVVTGTLWAGSIAAGDALRLLPGGAAVRVRGLEVHGEPLARAEAGQRVAVNLAGAGAATADRGDVLAAAAAAPGAAPVATTILDCALELAGAHDSDQVHVHHGTREAPGRLTALGEELWQLRLDRPLLALDGDRVVVRRSSPPATLGGGMVLDAAARRHGRRADAQQELRRRLAGRPRPAPVVPPASDAPLSRADPQAERDAAALEQVLRAAGVCSEAKLEEALVRTGGSARRALRLLRADGRAVRVSGRLYAHAEAVAAMRDAALGLIDRDGAVTLGGLRDELGASRRIAQAFLEHLDDQRVTRRLPDDRRVRAARRAGTIA